MGPIARELFTPEAGPDVRRKLIISLNKTLFRELCVPCPVVRELCDTTPLMSLIEHVLFQLANAFLVGMEIEAKCCSARRQSNHLTVARDAGVEQFASNLYHSGATHALF